MGTPAKSGGSSKKALSAAAPEHVYLFDIRVGEKPEQHAALMHYCRQPYTREDGKRSLRSLVHELYPKDAQIAVKFRSHLSRIGGWSRRLDWVARSEAYDRYIQFEKRQQEARDRQLKAEKWEGRTEIHRDETWDTRNALLKKANEVLALPVVERHVKHEEVTPDGRTIIQHITIKPVRITGADLVQMFALAHKLGALATNQPTDSLHITSPDQLLRNQIATARRSLDMSYEFFPDLEFAERTERIAALYAITSAQLLDGYVPPPQRLAGDVDGQVIAQQEVPAEEIPAEAVEVPDA